MELHGSDENGRLEKGVCVRAVLRIIDSMLDTTELKRETELLAERLGKAQDYL